MCVQGCECSEEPLSKLKEGLQRDELVAVVMVMVMKEGGIETQGCGFELDF